MYSRHLLARRAALIAAFACLLAPGAPATASEGNWVPKGHYLSFDRSRNLQTAMLDLLERPHAAQSSYHLGIAQNLHEALQTPGVKGVWMQFAWRDVEVADGKYDWSMIDANMDVLRDYGLKLIIKIADRSFNGVEVMPDYFPAEYVLQTEGGGKYGYTSKRWAPYVYNRLIRLHEAIANRYRSHLAFGGIATAETATGNFSGGDYTVEKYAAALDEVVTRTQAALERGRLFFYLNFLKGGDASDMNQDQRVKLLKSVPHENLVIGAPDITPDVQGMPRSVTAYRLHVRRNLPEVQQFCHLQHIDQGQGNVNVKNNQHRQAYFDEIARVRDREQQAWFQGVPAVFELDDLRDSQDRKVDVHPQAVLGELWTPSELFRYGRRNFGCDYFMWHYREHPNEGEFTWSDIRAVIRDNPCFYHPQGCAGAAQAAMPRAPGLR